MKDFLGRYLELFNASNINVDSIILFGSQARGTAMVSSDIDISVVMKESLSSQDRGHLRCLG
ncbi:MAG: nucleotidyltransferase domain-containing protein [Defluviitaleaceae bacterium]|nr:nucleotidyltransferase domain-containing protein [Defluviitaleaceae bacterium]